MCHEGVGELLSTLKAPLRIEFYATRSLPKVAKSARAVAALLGAFKNISHGKLEIKEIDTTDDEAAKKAAKEAGLQEASFGEMGDGDVAQIAQGFFGMVFEYGAEKEVIPLLSPEHDSGFEFWIANKMREIRDRADGTSARVGVVVGTDEVALTEANLTPPQGASGPSMRSIVQQALPFYKFEDVDLASDINPDLQGLVITQPGRDFTDEELKRIDAFVMRGRGLAVMASAVNMKAADPSMKASLDLHHLDALLGGYGVEMQAALVRDAKHEVKIPATTATGGVASVTLPGVLLLAHDIAAEADTRLLDNDFVGFFRMDEVVFPFASPLVIKPSKQPDARIRVVARSGSEAVLQTASPLSLVPINKDAELTGEKGARDIAVVVDGKVKSAFGDASSDDARILVIASAQFLANPMARAGNPPPMPPQMRMMGDIGGDKELQAIAMPYARSYMTTTILTFKNVLDWMAADERIISCSALLLNQAPAKASGAKSEKKKCSKEQMIELMDSGLSLDDALEVCAKQK